MRPRVIDDEETIVRSQDQSCNGVQRVPGVNLCGTGTSGCAVLDGARGWEGWMDGWMAEMGGRMGNN